MTTSQELEKDRQLSRRLPTVWPVFFQRFGRLTPVQREAIGPILDGRNILICAATASGKTEAAYAPLVERLKGMSGPWTILYLSPTRALVNDIHARLGPAAERLGLRLVRRTGEYKWESEAVPHILVTTPESLDSMLCRGLAEDGSAHVLAHVRAVVLDEIHLLHGSPRGEQTRWLIERLKRLVAHAYDSGWTRSKQLQIVGLSATVAEPQAVIDTFLPGGGLVFVPGKREIIEVVPPGMRFAPVERALPAYLGAKGRSSEKWVVFCNNRKRVDELTELLCKELRVFGYSVGAHHGSLGKTLREMTERDVRRLDRYVLVATSTIEIGVDIGDVDGVALDAPPPDMAAFLQRIGRGNRRSQHTQVMLCARSEQDAVLQEAMLEAARVGWFANQPVGPISSVLRQQVLSYIFQGKGGVRSREFICRLFEKEIDGAIMQELLTMMANGGDIHDTPRGVRLTTKARDRALRGELHSVIETLPGQTAVDSVTGRRLANQVKHLKGKGLSIGGNHFQVVERSAYSLKVKSSARLPDGESQWSYVSGPANRRTEHPMVLRHKLLLAEGEWPVVQDKDGYYCAFHLGGVRMSLALRLLSVYVAPEERPSKITPYYVSFREELKPRWLVHPAADLLHVAVSIRLDTAESQLGLPLANRMLPDKLRLRDVQGWLRPEGLVQELRESVWTRAEEETVEVLGLFIGN
ncbi:DEAD/DEAH box helicase [Paenibacillus sp. JMULE4]|uniref:DEAD/DEAH box helicase n=1 Tax=Paenibacillus TaxID=44249 RepID=UPI00088908F4|nr:MULTISPECIES: DEAD/DEAH box helicase [Paenibacillus]NTZ17301.1 DEAD/DEAH box helicase [Paenibacillus sp. JMULE4]SDJ91254.1 ATP-dependent helicase Lhr and Lhr-like helicase [Paenibacillus naphthalenovorans]